jgi:iron complex transport system ATP-binding protein
MKSSALSPQPSAVSQQPSDFAHRTSDIALSTQHSALATSDLAIGYPVARHAPKVILNNINVNLKSGELVCLIGPNGAGKSTLMRTLAGMQPPLAGSISLMGNDLHGMTPRELAKHLSIVLTERIDIGVMTAYALVALGRYPYTGWMGKLMPEDDTAVRRAIESVGAAELAGRYLHELSDGERQKILIARALAQEPAVLLLDEPTAYLDLPRRAEIISMLKRLARDTGRAILLSTHDLDLALRNADRIWLLPKGGPLQVGAPEDLVLSGTFEAAFKGEGVMFDPYSGSFRTETTPAGMVDLIGDGLPALWTMRALEREGFCVVRWGTDAPMRVEIIGDNSSPRWRLVGEAFSEEYPSLSALIEAIRLQVSSPLS